MRPEKGKYTLAEILSQPEAWADALAILNSNKSLILDIDPARRYDHIIYTGCGSTYYLAMAAASLTQELTGRISRAFPASELWLYPTSSYSAEKTLLVAISRSGETTETLKACQAFLSAGRGDLLTLSCYADMPLAKLGKFNIIFPSGQERSVAQTRAFSTLSLATIALACLWAGRVELFDSLPRLSESGRRILKDYASLAAQLGREQTLERFYWLGSGPRQGLACELSLKMKEMSLTHSEPFHFMEFRHGPKSMVTPHTLVVGLRSSVNGKYESAVLDDVKALGGQILDLAEDGSLVRFNSGLAEPIQNVLYLPVGQLIAFERALSKGLDPDRPTNLDTVVKLS